MAIYQGTYWEQTFALKDSNDAAINLTGMEFEADVRISVDAEDALLTLTNANGGFEIVDAAQGRLKIKITSVQSETLPLGSIVADVHHSNASPGPQWLFRFKNKVKKSVTRDE